MNSPAAEVDIDERLVRALLEMQHPDLAELPLVALDFGWDNILWRLDAEPWSAPPVWLHGDPHPANLLIEHGTLAGVIDFGDVCAGDPASDLASAWMLLPFSAIPAFYAAYGTVAPQLERRALGWAVHFAAILLLIGLEDKPTYEAVARATLSRVSNRVLGSQ